MSRAGAAAEARRPCVSCGGEVAPDGYCLRCGTRAVPARDHFTERPASWVAGICDRGPVKAANEDAMALWATPRVDGRAALVVLDGVSEADDCADASLRGARAARGAMQDSAATTEALLTAARAAQDAVAAASEPGTTNPPAATFAAALVDGDRIVHAGLGDSRVYWLPDVGDPRRLTTDDSVAEALVAAGTPRATAESSPQAHVLTRWLGHDSEDPRPRVGTCRVSGPGWLLVCTDGLWNYASSAVALRDLVRDSGAAEAADAAAALWRFACGAGGHDNITVAVARLESIGDNGGRGTGAGRDTGETLGEESRGATDG